MVARRWAIEVAVISKRHRASQMATRRNKVPWHPWVHNIHGRFPLGYGSLKFYDSEVVVRYIE